MLAKSLVCSEGDLELYRKDRDEKGRPLKDFKQSDMVKLVFL